MFLLLTSKSLFSLSGFLACDDPWGLGEEVMTPGEGVRGGGGVEAAAAAAAATLPPTRTPMLDLLVGVCSVACAEILRSERSREAASESNTLVDEPVDMLLTSALLSPADVSVLLRVIRLIVESLVSAPCE